MNTVVILPAYNPSQRLLEVVDGLFGVGFSNIILVDDGSGENSRPIFDQLSKDPRCTVLHHEVNRGKGRALKTGFRYFLDNYQDISPGVVTTDDDGQHTPEDIAKCAVMMEETGHGVFGVRDFSGANIPPKSRFGNRMTSLIFQCCCGINLSDTQTGLRALPSRYLEAFCQVKGERFEYETNMLLTMRENGWSFIQQPITTIYEDSNKSTHFNPIKDSIRIYTVIIKYLISSLSCSLLDVVLFTVLNLWVFTGLSNGLRELAATAAARLISSLLNYIFNRKRVFHSSRPLSKTLFRYYTVVTIQMCLSYGIVMAFTAIAGIHQSFIQTLIKIITDIVLFFASFFVQREWVFKNKEEN